ncbi:accessory gene regulator B family protein [Cohnella sp. 56]|uniref:accessory gene regulator B family protein n=1 Tax=Cohnella sp. 56 TaxID=3113722 RepID=UPI0030E7A0FE
MLRSYSENLNLRMNAAGVKAPSADVIEYALKIILNTVSIIVFTIMIGLITGSPGKTALVLAGFAILRIATGGYHLRSGIACIAASTVVLSILPHINLSAMWTYILTSLAFFMVAVFAPSNFDKYAWVSSKHYPLLKVIGLIIVSMNFVIVSDTLALAFLVQVMLLPFSEGGEKK